jgi:hypothetical protein
MTFDDETLMAFADGELDPLMKKRVERAMVADPELAERIAMHRALRLRVCTEYPLNAGRDPLSPDPLATMIAASGVVAMPVRSPPRWQWVTGLAALAACLILGIALGTQWQNGPARIAGGTLVASGRLAEKLDTQLASASGEPRMLVSFRNQAGDYCRVFTDNALEGIACKNDRNWKLVRTRSTKADAPFAYRQAGSPEGDLMADAQAMMKGDPLDENAEQNARAANWMPPK